MGSVSYLVDTHALLWWLFDDARLSSTARSLIEDPSNRILVSSASGWEIATKHRLGKLGGVDVLVRDIPSWIQQAGFQPLSISMAHAQRAGSWPQAHRDPFDRMLAAQSELENTPLITSDRSFPAFGIALAW